MVLNSVNLLALSTAEPGCCLAVVNGDDLVYEEYWHDRRNHSLRLFGMIRHAMMDRLGMDLGSLDGFIVASGPGSFTGLRIGISVVRGLALALDKPVQGISSLDGIAFRFTGSALPVQVMMDARRGQVYCALYGFKNGRLVSKSSEKVLDPADAVHMAGAEPVLFVGSGARAYRDFITEKACQPYFTSGFDNSISPLALIRSFYSEGTENLFSKAPMVLNYIRKSDAEAKMD